MNIEFENNGYLFLQNFLDVSSAKQLGKTLKDIVTQEPNKRDDQCPGSPAISKHPVFDCLLEELQPHLEQVLGKKLFPTYSYARLYQPGEKLLAHRDRPACEISITLTLDYEGEPWPIFMADMADSSGELVESDSPDYYVENKVAIYMNPGDAVLYKGCEKVHWREQFTGTWAAQVFLHYVDATGSFKEERYDRRNKLSHHEGASRRVENIGGDYRLYPDAFSKEQCLALINHYKNTNLLKGTVGIDNTLSNDIRDVNLKSIPSHIGVGATLAGIALAANQHSYRFDITHSNQTNFLQYDANGHYHAHIDTFLHPEKPDCRKLTSILFLNDDYEGGKFFLHLGPEKTYPAQAAGTVLVFPSFILHGVEPVTKGVRYSIVNWLVGPWFR